MIRIKPIVAIRHSALSKSNNITEGGDINKIYTNNKSVYFIVSRIHTEYESKFLSVSVSFIN